MIFALLVILVVGFGHPWATARIRVSVLEALEGVFRARYEVGAVHVGFLPLEIELSDFRVFLEGRPVLTAATVEVGLERVGMDFELARLTIHGGDFVFLRNDEGGYSFDEVLVADTFKETDAPVRVPEIQVFGSRVAYEDPRLVSPVVLEDASGVVRPYEGRQARYFMRVSGSPHGAGRVVVEGTFALLPEATGEFTWRLDEVSTGDLVEPFGPLAPRFAGQVRGSGSLEGPLRHPTLEGSLHSDWIDFQMRGEDGKRKLFLRGVDLGLRTRPDHLILQPSVERIGIRDPLLPEDGLTLESLAGNLRVSPERVAWSGLVGTPVAGGHWRARDGYWGVEELRLQMEVDSWPSAEALRLARLDRFEAEGEIQGEILVEGAREDPAWTVRASSPEGSLGARGSDPWTYQDLEVVLHGAGVEPRRLEVGRVLLDDAVVDVGGAVDVVGDGNALVYRIENLPLAPLGPLVDGSLTGVATVAGDVSGPLWSPRVRGRLHVRETEYRIEDSLFDFEHCQVAFDLEDGEEGVTGTLTDLKGRALGGALIEGSGALGEDGGALDLTVGALDAKRLFDGLAAPGVSGAGTVDAVATVRITPGALPSASLQFTASEFRLFIAPTKMTFDFEDLAGGLDLAPKDDKYLLYLRDVEGRSLGGTVKAQGYLKVHPDLYYDLAFGLEGGEAKEIAERILKIPDFSLAGPAAGEVTVKGDAGRSTVSGHGELGNSRIYLSVGGKGYTLYPERLQGDIHISPEEVVLGPLTGNLDGGSLRAEYRIRPAEEDLPWKISAQVAGVEMRPFWKHYLTQEHDLTGTLDGNLYLAGKGKDEDYLAGAGQVTVKGRVIHLDSLRYAEEEFDLRNLQDIEIHEATADIMALAGRLHAKEVVVKSSHGNAKGDIFLHVRSGELDGGFRVALERKVLTSGHRLASLLEGGNFFNFDLEVGGDLSDPKYTFSSDGLFKGAAMTGALMFTPAAVPLAVITGLKNLFRRRR